MKGLHMVTFVLLVVGGLNWLIYGLMGKDVVGYLPGGMTGTAAMVVYILVGLSAIYEIVIHKWICRNCNPDGQRM